MNKTPQARDLAITQRGTAWLGQFAVEDRELARDILDMLTLVAHSEFERGLTSAIEDAAREISGPVALFATREWPPAVPYFSDEAKPVDALPSGADIGSEGRVASLIRNLCRGRPTQFLNHPTIEEMRGCKCRAIFVVDDFVGSGQRTADFLSAMWLSETLRSWKSLHLIDFIAIAYSGTSEGMRRVRTTDVSADVVIFRDCPTLGDLPNTPQRRKQMENLLWRYAKRTSNAWYGLGFGRIGVFLVFEHGCPDNCPAVLWSSGPKETWLPMFPSRSVLSEEASVFPPEIARRDPRAMMISVGQRRLARSPALGRRGSVGSAVLTILGLVAQGSRTRSAIGFATGYAAKDVGRILEKCILWKLITPSFRVTQAGVAELNYAKRLRMGVKSIPPLGPDEYYPIQLRGPRDG